ncbi:MAG: malto-oligosyltrehalose synthase [Pseudomonadota bacterium]
MSETSILERLCARLGIASEYTDIWGKTHRASDATRRALVAAMGFPADEGGIRRALDQLESQPWSRGLATIRVFRQSAAPYRFSLYVPAAAASQSHRWALALEGGETRRGEVRPAALERAGERAVGGKPHVEYAFTWNDALPPGYHRFTLEPPGRGAGATMALVIAPERCYCPPALEGDGRVWGPALQLYALRSGRNWGIGDFTDLKNAIDAAARAGAGIVGLNPLHALFPHNPEHVSPYSPSSRVYLNVLYIDAEAVPEYADCEAARAAVADAGFQARLRALRGAELVDYRGVAEIKLAVLEQLYADFRARHQEPGSARGRAFAAWREGEGEPLERFALFNALQAQFHAEDPGVWGWPVWPEAFRRPDAPAVRAWRDAHCDRVDFHAWLQWIAEDQLAGCGLRSFELGIGVGVYQDLAVSVDRAGAEAWGWQDLYAETASIGAPPDDFNLNGQDWGLPPLIPQRLTESAYAPFIAMLRTAMRHAGALRIDHVMGLRRLFWVPPGGKPADGTYVNYPFDDLLGILALESQRNQCLVIGEDLGTVPDEVRAALGPLGVLSYRLLLFEKDAEGHFKPPEQYPPQALVAASTHDLPTLKSYWLGHDLDVRAQLGLYPDDETRGAQVVNRAQDRARLLVALERAGLLPEGMTVHPVSAPEMTLELALGIHAFIARTPAKVLMVQMEDVLGQLEQVNLPGTTDQYPNWRRKLPLNLEEWPQDPRVVALAEVLRRERGRGARPETAAPGKPEAVPAVPRATYRLQLNRGFTFADAAARAPYLAALGVSHAYCSPYLKARPGSSHGYDIIDHNALNPEIGSAEDFERFCAALDAHGLRQMLDVVPNHMGVMGADNGYWLDVLENGPASVYAGYFDIDWNPIKDELQGRVLVPVLGEPYGAVLERGEIRLAFDAGRGEFSVWYYEHRFPVDPREYARILAPNAERLGARLGAENPMVQEFASLATAFQHLPRRTATDPDKLAERHRDKEIHKRHLASLAERSPDVAWLLEEVVRELNGTAGDPLSFDALHALLDAQPWRLAYWRVAADEINYRRFFDINDLAALRMENPEVFAFTHRLVLRLLEEGKVHALRIDHPDGLYDPLQYFRRLQWRRADLPPSAEAADAERFMSAYVVVEKILAQEESLPPEWPVHGTTGYEFLNLLNGVFVNPAAAARLERFYRSFTREAMPFDELLYQSKRLIMRTALAGELNVLAGALSRIAEADRRTCDFTLNGLRNALREVVACFPVYRTYVDEGVTSAADRRYIDVAVAAAKQRSRAGEVSAFDFVREVLLTSIAEGKPEAYRDAVRSLAMKVQQYTAPVTAKGLEDTSFYVYHRLSALNEVGGDPRVFGVTPLAFHRANRERQRAWPHTMLASSTHDNKRSEDVRARIDAISELSEEWRARVLRWSAMNRVHKRKADGARAPSLNDEYLLYQTLAGAWPLTDPGADALDAFRGRIREYMLKAVREAKVHTSWVNRNQAYEEAVGAFVNALLAPGSGNAFLGELLPFVRKLIPLGLYNSVSQTLLKLAAPGVPDIYQGTEVWDFSLVDPDNRRPVDYDRRAALLQELASAAADPAARAGFARSLLDNMTDGRIKLYVTWATLQLRARHEALFALGEYTPLRATGPRADHVLAFARRHGDEHLVVATGRLFGALDAGARPPVGSTVWAGAAIDAPAAARWLNVLTGETLETHDDSGAMRLAADRVFATLPWALLVPAVRE